MNVVDSSGWLEYLADGPNAQFFAPAVEDVAALIVPTISLYEVFKRVLQQADEGAALQAVAAMQQGRVVDLTDSLAVRAAAVRADVFTAHPNGASAPPAPRRSAGARRAGAR